MAVEELVGVSSGAVWPLMIGNILHRQKNGYLGRAEEIIEAKLEPSSLIELIKGFSWVRFHALVPLDRVSLLLYYYLLLVYK